MALAQQLAIRKALADGMKKGIVAKLSAEVRPSLVCKELATHILCCTRFAICLKMLSP